MKFNYELYLTTKSGYLHFFYEIRYLDYNVTNLLSYRADCTKLVYLNNLWILNTQKKCMVLDIDQDLLSVIVDKPFL